MKKGLLICLFYFLLQSASAQDNFSGTWQMDYPVNSINSVIKITLEIGSPEKNLLYPAKMKLQCDSFNATYQLLLAKKNTRQLGISHTKYPESEIPFSLGNWTICMNGTFDYSKDLKGNPLLTINRIPAKKYGIPLPEPDSYSDAHSMTAMVLRDFLKDGSIQLSKTSNAPWQDETTYTILQPDLSAAYFGIMDTIKVKTRNAVIHFDSNKDNDIISLYKNGINVVDQVDSKKKRDEEEIVLDTGMNIIAFFADDYGKNAPATASLEMSFDKYKRSMNFAAKENTAATFIIAKVYFDNEEEKNSKFATDVPEVFQQPNTNPYGPGNASNGRDTSLRRSAKIIGNLISTSRQIQLAIWDDAIEDGDSISLSINGRWITQGFPVKKQPQFLNVTLEPGPNTITFVADNLGSIVPNTAVLEIIDGKKRKSFMIDTDLDKNNLVRIYYDYRPGE